MFISGSALCLCGGLGPRVDGFDALLDGELDFADPGAAAAADPDGAWCCCCC
ncbi:hypothetical protein [Candidatus Ichthyocystis sparus]|uniref:hypothetical protein n=1 Tax=Candidatus Ichthyocystis sparus TaxID=1561004 RepID=UPI00159EE502|nr:hypothetical protein [Candidatus Ichthyocystis sparus]